MSNQAPTRIEFKAGNRIFSTGDQSDFCYQIFSGSVSIVLNVKGVDRTVAKLGPGEVFGEMGIIDDGPRSATAVAETDTVCIAYTPDDILYQIDNNPQTMSAIMKTLIKRLRDANKSIAEGDADSPLTRQILGRLIG
jgi:CRP-like cAMP-binding protein